MRELNRPQETPLKFLEKYNGQRGLQGRLPMEEESKLVNSLRDEQRILSEMEYQYPDDVKVLDEKLLDQKYKLRFLLNIPDDIIHQTQAIDEASKFPEFLSSLPDRPPRRIRRNNENKSVALHTSNRVPSYLRKSRLQN